MNCPECGAESKVLGSRSLESMTVVYRRRVCQSDACGHRFSSLEVYGDIWASLKPRLQRKAQAVTNRRWFNKRNAEIRQRVAAGEKQAVLASEFGLSQNTVSQIAGEVWAYRKRGLK